MNIDLFYTFFLSFLGVGMFLYSRSLPVALVSSYIVTWFFPQELRLYAISIYPANLIGLIEIIYLLFNIRKGILFKNIVVYSKTYLASLTFVLFVVAVMSSQISFWVQIRGLFGFVLHIVNILMVSFFLNSSKDFNKLFVLVQFLIIISGIYGIYSYVIGLNPFAEFVLLTHEEIAGSGLGLNYIENARGMLAGRISAFTTHPLMFGSVLSLCLFIVLFIRLNSKNKLTTVYLSLFALFVVVLMVLTGSRSILVAFILSFFYYSFALSPKQTLIIGFFVFLCVVIAGVAIEDSFLRSTIFFWEESDEIQGSSKDMRLVQFTAALDVISDDIQSFLFGLGRGWANEYSEKYGCVPPLYGFESIFLTSIVNMGLIGTFMYAITLFLRLYVVGVKTLFIFKEKKLYVAFLLCGFLIFSLTGEQYGVQLYIVVAFLIVKYCMCISSESISSESISSESISSESSFGK